MFDMVVIHVMEIPGRGVAMGGQIVAGPVPPPGSTVFIFSEGRLIASAQIVGIEFDIPRPKVGMLLVGVRAEDVPIGSRITSAEAWSDSTSE